MLETVTIEKLVHGGQGLATLNDGRKVFVWGALPGEKVGVRITKAKRSFAEGIADEILEASPLRVKPREANYLATSPWQIVQFSAENDYKQRIVQELFTQAHVALPEGFAITTSGDEWHYRNKMEYSFWGDEAGLHLALHERGSHQKTIVEGSELALPAVDKAAGAVLAELQKHDIRAGDLKTIIVRCSQDGQAVASLFVKPKSFIELTLPKALKGLRVYHSNPKSPASVPTKLLQTAGDVTLTDALLDRSFQYDVDSFFQVNVPIFERALDRIRGHANAPELVDMYAGVGSIGLSTASKAVTLVESDPATAAMARVNAEASTLEVDVIEASSEKALESIPSDKPVIFDPPRAGLHDRVIDQTLEAKPPQIIYLSCNPATQARDLAKLQDVYEIFYFEAFNFFPHTPHIETLAVLTLR
jgi:23S rRNA (uracil1939-C5)-methyltransferase